MADPIEQVDRTRPLHVNINVHTEAALRRYMDRHGTTLTETVRRLIGYGEAIEQAWEEGKDVLVREERFFSERYVKLERLP